MRRPGSRSVAALGRPAVLSLLLLSGCEQGSFSTQNTRIGPDDGTDSCRQYVVALDSTGNYFGTDILKGAAVGALAGGLAGGILGGNWKGALIGAGTGAALGGAAGYWSALQQQSQDQAVLNDRVSGDLRDENAAIDRTQRAFDQLIDCRFHQADVIKADHTAHRIDRPTALARLGWVKEHAQRDLASARRIDGQIAGRGSQFDLAADNLGAATPAPAAPKQRQATLRAPAPLKVSPNPSASDIATLPARQPVTIASERNGYALVETPSGQRGYTSTDAIAGRSLPTGQTRTGSGQDTGDVRSLAGSNAARRDDFSQSVAVSERAAASGFELSS